MCHSSAVGILTFGLCLVACLSESTEVKPPTITADDATTAVNAAKQSAEEVFGKAQGEVDKAKPVLARLKAFATEAKNTEDMAAEAEAKVLKEAKDNKNAKDLIDNIKNMFNTVTTLHVNATEDLQNAISLFTELRNNGEKLKNECDTKALVISDTEDNLKAVHDKAVEMKGTVDKLDKNLDDASSILTRVDSTEANMKKSLKDAHVTILHVSAIVTVEKIDAMIGKADGILTNTQNQRNAVNGIVQNMQKHCTTDLVDSYKIIKEQCNSANGEFTKAKAAVEKAQNAVTAMKQQKGLAETALENVQKPETVLSAAEEEVRKADECVSAVQRRFLQLQSALQTDENYVTKAKDSQQKLVAALSTTTTKPNTEQITATENADPPVANGTELGQKETTIKPTSKDAPDQSNNSADKLKDALSNSAQNVPTTALTGEKAPAPGAKNDSAMTVSVPLLVALIASAALQ